MDIALNIKEPSYMSYAEIEDKYFHSDITCGEYVICKERTTNHVVVITHKLKCATRADGGDCSSAYVVGLDLHIGSWIYLSESEFFRMYAPISVKRITIEGSYASEYALIRDDIEEELHPLNDSKDQY